MGTRYREMEIRTATPEMIIVKLYEGAIRFIRQAKKAQQEGAVPVRTSATTKALAIVSELQQSLNMEQGGEVAQNLDALYFFVTERLLEANVRGTLQPLDDAEGILRTLNEAWVQIAQQPSGLSASRPMEASAGA